MVKDWLVSLFNLVLSYKKYAFLAFAFIVLLILFTQQVKAFVIIGSMGIASTFVTYYKRFFQAPPVLELTTLTTAAVSVFYGPWLGAAYTLVVTITMEVAAQALDPFSITYIFPRVVVAFISPWLYAQGVSIPVLGLLASITYNALQQPVYYALTDVEKRIKGLYFSVLNIPLNFLIFKFIGEPLFLVLSKLT